MENIIRNTKEGYLVIYQGAAVEAFQSMKDALNVLLELMKK